MTLNHGNRAEQCQCFGARPPPGRGAGRHRTGTIEELWIGREKAQKAWRSMTATNAKKKGGGWKRPEECQGNDGQGNKPENAFFHSLDKHSPDFGSFLANGGQGILQGR
jgi:hypothetical protein